MTQADFNIALAPADTRKLLLLLTAPAAAAIALVGAGLQIAPHGARAIPSFARQTGQPCMACHTDFPQLTPFGRRFKLGGYTLGGGKGLEDGQPPIAAMVAPTFTHTARNQDSPPTPQTHTNNNFIPQQFSLFYGGKIYGNLGAFVQGTFDYASQHSFLDNTDIRYADTTQIGSHDLLYGVSVNNGPTVQDAWNTTPAWGYPFISSSLAPQFSLPGAQIEGNFSGRSVGVTAYGMLNDIFFVEGGLYRGMSKGMQRGLGLPCSENQVWADYVTANSPFNSPICASDSLRGFAPYWRVAIEPVIGAHSFMIGVFGFHPQVAPGGAWGVGVDRYDDIGVDAQYQYIGDVHSLTWRMSHITERQHLNATFWGLGGSFNPTNYLNSFKTSATYVWDHTIAATAGYFSVTGSADPTLYSLSNIGAPTGKGLQFELSYMPFNKGGPSVWPWANAKIGVQYTHYLKMYGGSTAFDYAFAMANGTPVHHAKDNDTLLLYTWFAF
ncbi:MAG: cytochrome C [Hyphomicrobiales bacterium]|nr:cytochrome C [Hyphomicrobiales bacterium]